MKNILLALMLLMCAVTARAEPIDLGTVELVQDYQGIPIKVPVGASLDVQTGDNKLRLGIDLDVDMSDVQRQFQALVGTFSLPSDNCAGYGQNVVAKLKNASLRPTGNQAIIDAKARVAVWTCQKGVPGGGTTIEWRNKCYKVLGKKICTKVPHKVTIKPGSDIKTILVEDDVSASMALLVSSPDATSVEITPLKVDVELHNDITKFLNSIAAMFKVSVDHIAKDQLGKVVSSGILKKAIPEEFMQYNPSITALSFYTRTDGTLGLKISLVSELAGAQLNQFIKDMLMPAGATPSGPAQGTTVVPQ